MDREKNLEEFLSFVRHELRGQLVIVREGTAQLLEGFGNKDCDKCFGILKPALESTAKLNRLIEELLSTAKFKSLLKDKEDSERLKNELITMISHAVRTPLTIIKEGLSLVLDEIPGKLNSKQNKFLLDVKNNVDRLVQSMEEILNTPWDKIIKPLKISPKILLVEDEPDIVNLVKIRLESNNYEVITAYNGKDALEKTTKENPDLIILDLMLPKMDGYEVARRLKTDKASSGIPIIIFTAAVGPDLNQKVYEIHATDCITKPFEPKELLEKVERALGGRNG